jgi:hypothetical protein
VTSKLQKKPSALKREHPALQNMKFLNFSTLVGHFCPPRSGFGFRIRIRIHWIRIHEKIFLTDSEKGGEACLITEHVLDLAQLLGNVESAAFHPLPVHLVKHLRVVVNQVNL